MSGNTRRFAVKNGLLTQNIQFTSADGLRTIDATMLNDGVISFSGTSGQLFTVADSMTGTIFGVNDISGIPSLEIDDTGVVRIAQFAGNVLIGTATNGTDKLRVNGNTQVNSLGVGTAASGTVGEIRATNNITAFFSSDARLKENVKPITDALNKVSQIRGVEFDWTQEYLAQYGGEDGYFVRRHDVGVIAQEIQTVLPEVVAQREDGTLAVKYDRVVSLLIEAIKELREQVEQLKANK